MELQHQQAMYEHLRRVVIKIYSSRIGFDSTDCVRKAKERQGVLIWISVLTSFAPQGTASYLQ